MATVDYDGIASDYARHRQVHPEVLRGLVSTSGVDCDSKVLEVGCGTGNYVRAVQRLVGCQCWGIDPSEGMLSKAGAQSGRVHLKLGRAENIDFLPDFFDLVFSVDVIHHVEDRSVYYREASRVLMDGGKLCTVTDSEWIIRHRQPLSVYFPETVEPELDRYPRILELRELMGQAGFSAMSEELVEFSYQLTDIRAYQDKVYSALHLIPADGFQRGIMRMEGDLRAGPIPCVSHYALLWGTK
jgi:ubiquinone/menaquinone biosynthesis C-methylase UbiE